MGKYNKINFDNFKNDFKEKEKKKSFDDERFWKFTYDKATQKGSAIIRFLPDTSGTPFVKFCQHFFKYQLNDATKYYTKKCITSLAEYDQCPVCVKNGELYKSVHESDKAIFKERKRKFHYVANIQVIKDGDKPDTEGNIYLFDFGPQIFEIYSNKMFGPEGVEDIDPDELFVPCDFDEGADFQLRAGKKKGTQWVSYDSSTFKKQVPLFEELDGEERDEAIDGLMDKTHSLEEWQNIKNYPSKEEVIRELNSILGKSIREEAEETEDEYLNDGEEEVSEESDSSDKEMSDEDFMNDLASEEN